MSLSKGKTMELSTFEPSTFEPSTFEPPSFIITREPGQRKTTLLSKTLLLFRKNKIRYSEILAPGTTKENTRDGFFLKGLRIEDSRTLRQRRDGLDSARPFSL